MKIFDVSGYYRILAQTHLLARPKASYLQVFSEHADGVPFQYSTYH